MDRGPLALFGAIVAVGVGPALWMGVQLGAAPPDDPVRPPAVTEPGSAEKAGQSLLGGAGAGEEAGTSPATEPRANVLPLTTSASPTPSGGSKLTGTTPAAEPTPTTSRPVDPPTESTTAPTSEPTETTEPPVDDETIPPAPPGDETPGDETPGGEPSGNDPTDGGHLAEASVPAGTVK